MARAVIVAVNVVGNKQARIIVRSIGVEQFRVVAGPAVIDFPEETPVQEIVQESPTFAVHASRNHFPTISNFHPH